MRAVNAVTTSWAGLHVDRPSFSAVAESELDAVHRYLLFLTGNRTVAEDLTGETFEKAFRAWRRFDPRRGTPRAWLCRIARSSALDHFRSEERRKRREDRYARGLPESVDDDFGRGPLETAVARLSAAEREVVALRVLLELDGPTAARVLGISTTACSTRLSRALKKLEEMMNDARD
jgi:RNA polymerase sigma-70 factor (ECF subfamily)